MTRNGYPVVPMTDVDRAWKQGYDAGRKDRFVVAGVVGVVAYEWAKKHRIHPVWIVTALVVIIPVAITCWAVRELYRTHRQRKAERRIMEPWGPRVPGKNGDPDF